jgi:hypothetical protein
LLLPKEYRRPSGSGEAKKDAVDRRGNGTGRPVAPLLAPIHREAMPFKAQRNEPLGESPHSLNGTGSCELICGCLPSINDDFFAGNH